MSIKVRILRGLGDAYLNCVRSAAYVGIDVIRPIGVRVGGSSNVVDISNSVQEDMPTVISAIVKGNYTGDLNPGELLEVKIVSNGELMLSDLLNGSRIKSTVDLPIMHSMVETEISVVFAYTHGWYKTEDNMSKLEKAGYSGYVAVNSRHCGIDTFTYNKVMQLDHEDVYDVNIRTINGQSEEKIFRYAQALLASECVKIIS